MRREGRPGYARALPRPARQPTSPARSFARAPSAERPGLDALAGGDAAMAERVRLARRLLDRGLPILLQGETGTGKDAFARAMHGESVRRDAPFIAVNCAAIPATLLDAELFGYAPGTFTGGLKEGKPGRIAAADGGTLFLDEIGDMPLELQTRLLRVLADGEVAPLGGGAPRRVDFSLICATHRDLDRLVAEGGFRQDLYYRIAGATIALPALRQRSDIAELAQAFLAAEHPGVTLSAPALALIAVHAWPGNIRQLRHALTFAALTCRDGRIAATDLPAPAGPQTCPAQPSPLRQAAGAAERVRILSALAATGGRVAGAARLLGVSRATLHRRLRSLAIRR
jgi:transcriptional regulator of acetoin/glycerol metabolism